MAQGRPHEAAINLRRAIGLRPDAAAPGLGAVLGSLGISMPQR